MDFKRGYMGDNNQMGDHRPGSPGMYQYNNSTNNATNKKQQFNIMILIIIMIYSYGLVYVTFVVMMVRKRIQANTNVPVVIYYIVYYMFNILLIRTVFGYHFMYQLMITMSMGYTLIRYKNVNIIGLTGGIGCGKTTLGYIICDKLKCEKIDCDKITHDLQSPGKACYNKIVNEFGYEVLDKDRKIDRNILRGIVFNDRLKKKRLERIMHIEIFKYIFYRLKDIFSSTNDVYAIIDAPLLYETGILKWICYPVIVVYIGDRDVWIDRIMKRDKCTKDEAILKVNNQMNIENKIKQAEVCIDNNKQSSDMYTQFVKKFTPFIYV